MKAKKILLLWVGILFFSAQESYGEDFIGKWIHESLEKQGVKSPDSVEEIRRMSLIQKAENGDEAAQKELEDMGVEWRKWRTLNSHLPVEFKSRGIIELSQNEIVTAIAYRLLYNLSLNINKPDRTFVVDDKGTTHLEYK